MDFSTLKFLVVDDHALLRHVLRSSLQPYGIRNLDWAIDGIEALEKIKTASAQNAPYDVVFLDWNMPRMSGFDVLSSCRNDRQLDRMAIVMLTAESETDSITRAMGAGATAYITKPFQPETIVKKLEDIAVWQKKMSSTGKP